MTVKELYTELNKMISVELSCSWDNDGLMCCPNGEREVGRVLVALDVTDGVADLAVAGGYDLIVSHHPFIFKGLKSVNEENYVAAKAIKLIQNGISVFSFHTRLDAVRGGVNDVLAELLGIKNAVPFGDEGIGRVGELSCEIELSEFAKQVKNALGAPVVLSAGKRRVKRVAVLGGEGGDDIYSAISAGADTYVSGRLGYHNMTDASGFGINLLEAGHFYTEAPVCNTLKKMLCEIDGGLSVDVVCSNEITAI